MAASHALDHVALLVPSLEGCLEALRGLNAGELPLEPLGEPETFAGEGTRELYLGKGKRSGRLLLLEPAGPGPYLRALDKRGPGLHHLALRTPSIQDWLRSEAGAGWLLHPHSLQSVAACKTAWLARPGIPTLIELTADEAGKRELHVEGVSLPCAQAEGARFQALGAWASLGPAAIQIAGRSYPLAELCGA